MQLHLLILFLVGLVSCGPATLVSAGDNVALQAQRRLEAFAKDPNSLSTGMTYEDYEAFYRYVKEHFSKKFLDERRLVSPTQRLLQDFVLTPMERWRLSEGDDDFTKQAYVNRMEQSYKHFWPSYIEGKVIGKRLMYLGLKVVDFIKSMQKKVPQEPTLDMWHKASESYEALKKRVEEMVTKEDIYDQLENYEYMVNFFNDFDVKYLMDHFAPYLDKCTNDLQLKPIIAEYRRIYEIK